MNNTEALREAARVSKAWPYEEARKLLKRFPEGPPEGRAIVFETGYGPSGLPHLGTFQEVARTLWVKQALAELADWPSRLIAFSDDMDGMRKVPPNMPNHDLLQHNIDKPLSVVPDPYGCHESYAAHNNGLLRQFLDRFGFEYEFLASSDCYGSGRFDDTLRRVLRHYDDIMGVMLPTLGEERRKTYSPVLPISPASGKVLQVPVEVIDADAGTIRYVEPETGETVEQSILSGGAKLQWKVDWAMRWVALGVDYEMAGKDLIDSVALSGKIARILGARPPEGFNYEMFLDEDGQKISKSKGNGLTIDEWLRYAPEESLSFYLYREPKKAKQLSFGIIPKAVDEYHQFLGNYPDQEVDKRLGNPVHHIHDGDPPQSRMPITFALLLNLVSVASTDDKDLIWGFVKRHAPDASPETHPELDALIGFALTYFRDFIADSLFHRAPDANEAEALRRLDAKLVELGEDASAEAIQDEVYEIGKTGGFESLRDWFKALYETLLGTSQGPRMGTFIAMYGVADTRKLIAEALAKAE
ncbi:lysine--tRNA ligase [Allosphingosinicella indica]|uniref:Lysine--tRNA ligase n=1 Tax=Allosphingosinicella indica TaxID=941907 RepID=A0A1X7FZT2_9SPHN|nr:lysine--tRNA ligase [Allosphingosinicella indica]SMF61526.1 lysyl-tRNA synthetase, class I [Allosphingosinicella indica]